MAADATLQRPGAALRFVDAGTGAPVLFQHGLGGDAAQVAEVFPPGVARRLTLECRAHGGSEAGPFEHFGIARFAEDVLALADAAGVGRAVLGGVSMGAAIALRLAVLHPARARALILLRPAWLLDPAPANMQPFVQVADLLARLPPDAAKARFAASDTAALLRVTGPDNLASLLGFFDRPHPRVTAALLAAVAADGPGVSIEAVAALRVPTLLIGNGLDHVHPLAFAETLAATIPGARMVAVTPKAENRASHAAEVRAAIAGFLATLPRAD